MIYIDNNLYVLFIVIILAGIVKGVLTLEV